MDGPRSAHRLSLVIPAFNEEAGIRQAAIEADNALANLAADHEILVVDDGSSDDTATVVEALQKERPRVRLLRHSGNRGYGAALRTGFTAARFECVAFTDADCQFHLEDLEPLLRLTDDHDIAVGWRIDRQDPWRRRFCSRGYNVLVRTLLGTGVRDCDCALKVFRRDAVQELLPETNGFFVNAEMLTRARQLDFRIAETGVRHRPRRSGDSKVSLLDVPRTLRVLLPFWWSCVLFPGSACDAGLPDTNPKRKRGTLTPALALRACVLLLAVVAALLCFGRLGTALQEPTEVQYAEAARHLLSGGENGTLFTWLVAGSYRTFGVADRVARLVPATAAFLLILLTWFWGRSAVGPRAALIGAFMLCLSAGPMYLARTLTPDSVTALFALAGLMTAHRAATGAGWAWLLSAACWGAAVFSGASSEQGGGVLEVFAGLLLGMTPWVLLLPGLVAFIAHRSRWVAVQRPAALGWFLLSAVAVALVGLVSGNRGILLAAAAPLALALGFYLDRVLTVQNDLAVWWTWGVRGGRIAAVSVLVAAGVVCAAAGASEAVHPARALTITAALLGLAVLAARFPERPRPHTAWVLCGCVTFLLLFAGLHSVLPGHARRLSLRGQVRPYAALCAEEHIPVICYPQRWDSVEFYLRPTEVRVFTSDERAQMLMALGQQTRAVLVTGPGVSLHDLLRDLPVSLEFVPGTRGGPVTVGLVRPRPEAPDVLLADGR